MIVRGIFVVYRVRRFFLEGKKLRVVSNVMLKTVCCITLRESPRAQLHVVGMLRFMSDTNLPSLPTPFYSVLVSVSVVMALSSIFHSINSPDNSPFSHSVLPVLSLPCRSFQLCTSL